jgi:hypothetical protein
MYLLHLVELAEGGEEGGVTARGGWGLEVGWICGGRWCMNPTLMMMMMMIAAAVDLGLRICTAMHELQENNVRAGPDTTRACSTCGGIN